MYSGLLHHAVLTEIAGCSHGQIRHFLLKIRLLTWFAMSDKAQGLQLARRQIGGLLEIERERENGFKVRGPQ